MIGTIVLLLGLNGAAESQQPDVKEITQKIQRRYETITDATARFSQQVKFGYSKIEQNFSGILMMKKPNRYRIESDHQTLVTDGATVWSYSPVNKQVLVDRYKESQNSLSPEHFLLNLPSNYYASLLGRERVNETSQVTLRLVPKDDQSFVRSMKIWVEEETWVVRKVELVDVNDTQTVYTVHDIRLNSNLPDSTFAFSAPPGTEVVDLR